MINKLLVALVLSVASHNAMAKWAPVGSNKNYTAYADLSTITKSGEMVKMWGLNDLKVPSETFNKKKFLSYKFQQEYECKGEKTRFLSLVKLSGAMGTGDVVYRAAGVDGWAPVSNSGVGRAMWKAACNKK